VHLKEQLEKNDIKIEHYVSKNTPTEDLLLKALDKYSLEKIDKLSEL